eukprot:7985539-Heterocapsa_arctica.AAC.1
MDVKQAFDEMSHRQMAEALYQSGADLGASIALAQELEDMRGRATLAESSPIAIFTISKGGKTGGVETPWIFNVMLQQCLKG